MMGCVAPSVTSIPEHSVSRAVTVGAVGPSVGVTGRTTRYYFIGRNVCSGYACMPTVTEFQDTVRQNIPQAGLKHARHVKVKTEADSNVIARLTRT
jgi:hypothetical protein